MKKRKKGRVKKFEERQSRAQELQNRDREEIVKAKEEPAPKTHINMGKMAMTVIILLLVAVLCVSVKSIFSLRAEQRALKEENQALLDEKAALQDELKNVNDNEYIEEQARIQLQLIKPGEILYILEDEEKNKDKKEQEKDSEENNEENN